MPSFLTKTEQKCLINVGAKDSIDSRLFSFRYLLGQLASIFCCQYYSLVLRRGVVFMLAGLALYHFDVDGLREFGYGKLYQCQSFLILAKLFLIFSPKSNHLLNFQPRFSAGI